MPVVHFTAGKLSDLPVPIPGRPRTHRKCGSSYPLLAQLAPRTTPPVRTAPLATAEPDRTAWHGLTGGRVIRCRAAEAVPGNKGEVTRAKAERKAFGFPDETRTFEKGKADLVKIGDGVVGRLTLEPGWRWSTHVKPAAKTEWCDAPHFQYRVGGRLMSGWPTARNSR